MSDKTHDDHETDDKQERPASGFGAAMGSMGSMGGAPTNWMAPTVLLILREMNSYGYDLMKALTQFGFALMNPGPLYRMLRQMEKDGLVSSSWDTAGQGPARRIYSITEAGEAYLKLWTRSLDQYRNLMDQFFNLYPRRPENK